MHKPDQTKLQLDRSRLPYSEHLGLIPQEIAQPNIVKKAHYNDEQIQFRSTWQVYDIFFFFLRNQVYVLITRIMFWQLMTWIVQGSGFLYHSSLASNFYYIMFWLLSCNVWDRILRSLRGCVSIWEIYRLHFSP